MRAIAETIVAVEAALVDLESRAAAIASLHPRQREMLRDPAKIKAALCGRRSGKTYLAAIALHDVGGRHPHATLPFVALTRRSAELILWPTLREANARYNLGLKFEKADLTARLPNGAGIVLFGADDERKMERLRGGKYPMVVIDEAASFPRRELSYLVEEILEPALLDYDGMLWMLSTPSAACSGYFHDVTTSGEIPVHRWTVRENPYLPAAAEYLEKKKAAKGWTDETPIFAREWLGRWVRDESGLVYPYTDANIVDALPESRDWMRVIACDIGASATTESTAYAILAYLPDDPRVWIERCWREATPTPTDIAATIAGAVERYSPDAVVMDAGALGGGYVAELRARHGLPVEAADKREKLAAIDLMAGDLRSGMCLVVRGGCEVLIDEWSVLQWDEERLKPDPRYRQHASDAAMYGWRRCRHWQAVDPAPPDPIPGDARWFEREREAMRAGFRRRARAVGGTGRVDRARLAR